MFDRLRRIGAWTGFLSAVGMMLVFLIVGLFYRGRMGEGFSLANHFVSELGEYGVSEMAWLFNASLVIGGMGILLGFIALALHLQGWFRYVILIFGFVTGVSGTLVGFFPMNNLESHLSVALTFFNTGWMVTGLFSVYLIFAKQKKFPRWLAIPGFVTATAFVAFSNYNDSFIDSNVSLDQLLAGARPDVWGLVILEWVVILSVLIWIAMVCAVMLRLEMQAQSSVAELVTD